MKKIVFACNTYGLGHATRSLPLIREALNRGYAVYIIGYGRPLEFLRKELGSKVTQYFALKDYSFFKFFTSKKVSAKKFFTNFPLFMKEVATEHAAFVKLDQEFNFDIICSDARPGIYIKGKPSFFMTNQIKIGRGFLLQLIGEILSEKYMFGVSQNFSKMIVPDTAHKSISGEITHNLRFLKDKDIAYIGILSMLNKSDLPTDLDYFVTISGPEPQRTVFEEKILKNLDAFGQKRVVITLGKPELANYYEQVNNIEIYGLLDSKQQEQTMNRAAFIISRSGYSTLMDLAELEKPAMLIPTTGQPEQEYLAKYHYKLKNNYTTNLKNLDLQRDLLIAKKYPGYKPQHKTATAVQNFFNIIEGPA